jgi:uncharacterized membrane protein
LYQTAAGQYGLEPSWGGVPVALAGQRTMRGLIEIGNTLGDDLDALAQDRSCLKWPRLQGLTELLSAALQDIRARVTANGPLPQPLAADPATGQRTLAHTLARAFAILVLVGMLAALGGSLWRVWRSRWHVSGSWRIWLGVAVGLGISGYTAYTSLADTTPVCGPIGDCAAVQQSVYAHLFGIPMGVLGLFGYGSILVAWIVGRRLAPTGGDWRWLSWGITLAGVLFSLRLTALEVFVINATCLWCLGSAVTISLLLWWLSGETRKVNDIGAPSVGGVI